LLVYGADGNGQMQTVLAKTDMGQRSDAVAWLTGGFTVAGETQIAQPFANNGLLGLIIYGDDGNGQMQTVLAKTDMGQRSDALVWLTGDFTGTGTGRTQIAQPFNTRPDLPNNTGRLGLIVYGDDGSGQMQTVFTTLDIGQGPGALDWLTGDFIGTGKDQIAQPFNNS
jgi:hypothetical protein